MPSFSYQAVDTNGKTVSGIISATDKNTAVSLIGKQKLKLVSMELSSTVKKGTITFFKPKVKISDLVLFTRQLSTMVSAGVPLLRSLNTMYDQVENPTLKEVIGDLIKDVEGGVSLAEAMQKHPDVFNDIFVNMIRAGEAAGRYD